MADLAAANVTVTVEERKIVGGQRRNRVKVAFGDGALTYPALGVPLPAASAFGLVRNLDYLSLFDNNDGVGIVWKFDKDNLKLRGWLGAGFTPAGTVAAPVFTGAALAAHTHALHFNNADVADSAGARVNVGTNLMGANTGADVAVAGVVDTAGAGGIVQTTGGTPAGTNSAPAFTGGAVAAASLAELTGAVAAQVLYAEAVGW